MSEWMLVPAEMIDSFPEINPNNYDHDQVCDLDAWGCDLVRAAIKPAQDDAKDALIAKLTAGLNEAKYRIEQGRIWNGMGWTLTGLHPHHQQQAIDAIDAAMGQGGSDE